MAREDIIYRVEVEDQASDRLRRLNRHLERSRRGFVAFAYAGRKEAAPAMSAMTSASRGLGPSLRGLATAGGVAQAALIALAAKGFGAAIDAAVDFEQAVVNAVAVTGGSYEELAKAATQASFDSAFSAEEAASAMEKLGMAGLDAAQATSALPGTLQLAAAGSLDLARAADISTNIMSGFSLQVEDLAHVNDVLAHTATNANTTVEDMGLFMSYVAPIAASSGQSIEMMAAAAGILGDAGLSGEKGSIAMRTGLLNLQAPTAAATATLKELGVAVNDASGDMRSVDSILRDIGEANASQAELTAIFGKRAVAGVGVLIKNVDKLSTRAREAETSIDGAARALEQTKLDSVSGQLRILSGSLKSTAKDFGGTLTPSIKQALKTTNAYIASGALLKDELLALETAVGANREALDGLATGSLAATVAGMGELVEGVSAAGSALAWVSTPFVWTGKQLGVIAETGNAAADTAHNVAEGVRLFGTAAAAAFTMVNPLVGGLGVLYGAFSDVGDQAKYTAEQMQGFKRAADFRDEAKAARASLLQLGNTILTTGEKYAGALKDQVQSKIDEANVERERLGFEARYYGMKISALEAADEIERIKLERDAELLKLSREDMDASQRAYRSTKLRADADAKIEEIVKRRAKDAKREADELERATQTVMERLRAAQEHGREIAQREAIVERELQLVGQMDALERAKLERELQLQKIRGDDSLTDTERRLEAARAEEQFSQRLVELGDERWAKQKQRLEEGREARKRARDEEAEAFDETTSRLDQAARLLDGVTNALDGDDPFSGALRGLSGISTHAISTAANLRDMYADGARGSELFVGALSGSGAAFAQMAGEFGATRQQMSGIQAAFYAAEAVGQTVFGNVPGAIAAGTAAAMHTAIALGAGGGGAAPVASTTSGAPSGSSSSGSLTPFSGRGSVDADQRRLATYIGDELERRASGGGGVTINFELGTVIGDDQEAMRQVWDSLEREGRSRGFELGRTA